jgi:hypothetical protein
VIAFERNLLKSPLNIDYSSPSSAFSAEPVTFRPANRQQLSRKCRQSLTPPSLTVLSCCIGVSDLLEALLAHAFGRSHSFTSYVGRAVLKKISME